MSKAKQGSAEGNVGWGYSRIKPMGRSDTLQWEDIRPEDQHLYVQIGKRLYHKGGLSPEQLRKFDTQYVTAEGYEACVIQRQTFGGNVKILSDRVPASEP
ncbi:hypothetical protein [Scytonema millei]|uniref:Uncharacterized protein n=1 Tax=Scytonema millei VB511283 TaxID=1245923 RepID=A0A9X5E4E6_9CYAN|nr:hypothetical protein [Scytonema millei]NHC33792.1 hypothetical protein [Scytonema millei VB511283]